VVIKFFELSFVPRVFPHIKAR